MSYSLSRVDEKSLTLLWKKIHAIKCVNKGCILLKNILRPKVGILFIHNSCGTRQCVTLVDEPKNQYTYKRWSEIKNACIKGNNYNVFEALTIDDCKGKCVNEAGINCQSIAYNAQIQTCHISDARSDSEHYTEPCHGWQYTDGWQYTELIIDAGN
ncbi:unnamed protein product, partial [Meganyctiphanes norvegica]